MHSGKHGHHLSFRTWILLGWWGGSLWRPLILVCPSWIRLCEIPGVVHKGDLIYKNCWIILGDVVPSHLFCLSAGDTQVDLLGFLFIIPSCDIPFTCRFKKGKDLESVVKRKDVKLGWTTSATLLQTIAAQFWPVLHEMTPSPHIRRYGCTRTPVSRHMKDKSHCRTTYDHPHTKRSIAAQHHTKSWKIHVKKRNLHAPR